MKRILMATLASSTLIFIAGSLLFVGHTQTLPAPTVDHVGFPAGYRDTFTKLYTFDNFQNRQIRVVWGNDIAASVNPGTPWNFPYGSIILFESYTVQEDANGEPLLDASGRFIPNNFTTVFVMRKEKGFGVDYKELRNGEWEYVSYPIHLTVPRLLCPPAQVAALTAILQAAVSRCRPTLSPGAPSGTTCSDPTCTSAPEPERCRKVSCSIMSLPRPRFTLSRARRSRFTTTISYYTISWQTTTASTRGSWFLGQALL